MKYIIISDLHANYRALKKFKEFIKTINYDKIIFTGDLAGHNGTPIEFIKEYLSIKNTVSVKGNCDKDVLINDCAIINNAFLNDFFSSIKNAPLIVDNDFAICHGTVLSESTYMHNIEDTESSFQFLSENAINLLFFGHIHIPKGFVFDNKTREISEIELNKEITLNPENKYLICSGSMGKPKIISSQGNFLIYDSEKKTVIRQNINIT